MVCTGNLCRSAMAEAMLRRALERQGERDVEVASAGTWAEVGSPATDNAAAVLRSRGIDLGSHRSRPLDRNDLRAADLVVAMTSVHVREILQLAPEVKPKLVLLKELAELDIGVIPCRASPSERLDLLLAARRPVPRRALDLDDPYGLPLGSYERCAQALEAGIRALVEILCERVEDERLQRPQK